MRATLPRSIAIAAAGHGPGVGLRSGRRLLVTTVVLAAVAACVFGLVVDAIDDQWGRPSVALTRGYDHPWGPHTVEAHAGPRGEGLRSPDTPGAAARRPPGDTG